MYNDLEAEVKNTSSLQSNCRLYEFGMSYLFLRLMFCKLLFYLYLLSLFGLILKNAFSEDDRVENTLLWCHLILSYIQHLMFEGSAKSPYNTGNVYGRNIPNLVHDETVTIL